MIVIASKAWHLDALDSTAWAKQESLREFLYATLARPKKDSFSFSHTDRTLSLAPEEQP